MKKISFLFILLLMIPNFASAHSTLTASFPAEGETVTEPLTEVHLTFSAGIEQGSTMVLTQQEETIEFTEIILTDTEMTGTLPAELADGAYLVEWTVLSADGHPLEGSYTFELDADIAAEEQEAQEEVESEEEEEAAEIVTEDATPSPFAANETASNEPTAFSPFIIIAVIALAGLIGAILVLRRNR